LLRADVQLLPLDEADRPFGQRGVPHAALLLRLGGATNVRDLRVCLLVALRG